MSSQKHNQRQRDAIKESIRMELLTLKEGWYRDMLDNQNKKNLIYGAIISGILILSTFLGVKESYKKIMNKLNQYEPNDKFKAKILSVQPNDGMFRLKLRSAGGCEFIANVEELENFNLNDSIVVDKSKLNLGF